jgi:hypothetical protein
VKLTLSFGEEAGTSRGGSDVWLQVELTTNQDPGSPKQAAALAGDAFDDWLKAAPTDEGEDNEVWVENLRVKTCCSEHYDFSVDRPVSEVRDEVVQLAREGVRPGPVQWGEGEWTYSLRTKVFTLKQELFRDGNAD